jgi:hypothetical protein
MQTFLMLYLGLTAQPEARDRQTVDYNKQWADYMTELATIGVLESSAPLAPDGKSVERDMVSPVGFAQVDIGGYAVIKAESLDAAVELAEREPHIALGRTTIIRQCLPVGR